MEQPTQAEVDAAKSAGKVDKVHLLTIESEGFEDTHILVRMPTQAEFRRWQRETADENNRIVAQSNLVTAVRLWPSKEVYDAMVAARPGIALTFSGEVIELAGLARSAQKKVL